MQIPYGKLELQIAAIGIKENIDDKLMEHSDWNALEEEMNKFENNRAEFNKATAAFHGVPLETLISSPAYNDLVEAYKDNVLFKVIAFLEEKIGLTNKEAYAVIVSGANII